MKSKFKFKKPSIFTKVDFSGLTVDLPSQVVVTEIPARQIKVSKIEVSEIVDNSTQKIVTAYTNNMGPIVLWEGSAYDAIGQWTDSDVEKRFLELYKSK